MRLKSAIWVSAFIRRCLGAGVPAVVVRHGDDEAGTIYIKVTSLDGHAVILGPAAAGLDGAESDRRWSPCLDPSGSEDEKVEAYLARELRADPDLWIVEIEDRHRRHFLLESEFVAASPAQALRPY